MSNKETIARLRAEADALEEKDRAFDALPEEYKLAITLHSMFCIHNHADVCGWEYEGTGGQPDWNGYAHKEYLQRALLIKGFCRQSGVAVDKAIELIRLAKGKF